MKQIARDVVGELLETGKQTIKQTAGVPKKVVQGVKPLAGKSNTPPSPVLKKGERGQALPRVAPSDLEKITSQTSPSDDQLMHLIQTDNKKRQEGVDRVRQQLAQLKVKRYREIQQKIQKIQKEKEQEIPAYIAGKPGAPRTREEQLELQEKQQKGAKEQKNKTAGVELPKGPRSKGSLFYAKQKSGSGEKKLGKQG